MMKICGIETKVVSLLVTEKVIDVAIPLIRVAIPLKEDMLSRLVKAFKSKKPVDVVQTAIKPSARKPGELAAMGSPALEDYGVVFPKCVVEKLTVRCCAGERVDVRACFKHKGHRRYSEKPPLSGGFPQSVLNWTDCDIKLMKGDLAVWGGLIKEIEIEYEDKSASAKVVVINPTGVAKAPKNVVAEVTIGYFTDTIPATVKVVNLSALNSGSQVDLPDPKT